MLNNIAQSDTDLNTILTWINEQELIAYDTETTGLNVRTDRVVGFGVSNGTIGYYIPVHLFDTQRSILVHSQISDEGLARVLSTLSKKSLIMFNASFDARVTAANFGIDLLPALHTDVLLLKHTCDEDFPLDLKGIAAKLWGHNVKAEKEAMQQSIKDSGGTSKEFFKASIETLGTYCIQDCLLTMRIYNHYRPILTHQGLEAFYYTDEVLPLYKEVTIPMESAGVYVDVPGLQRCLKEISADIDALEDILQVAMIPYMASFTEYYLNKHFPIYTEKGNLRKVYKDCDDPVLKQYDLWLDTGAKYMLQVSNRHHLKYLFFDIMKLEPLSTTPTGLPQADEDFFDSIALEHIWVQNLIKFNKLCKLKSTYIDRLLTESEHGKFYPSYKQHSTISGRYGGDMQQLPRVIESSGPSDIVAKYTNAIRSFIISPAGSRLCSSDYEQLEPSIFAHVSGDAALQDIFNKGLDFYSEVAIRTEKLSGVSSDKKAPNYLGKVNKAARQKAKAYALGIAYGMTGYKLHFELNCQLDTAVKLVDDYLAGFPDLAKWINKSHDQVLRMGTISTQSQRIRHMPQAKRIWNHYGSRILDSRYRYSFKDIQPVLFDKITSDYSILKNCLNNAVNFQIQGLGASIVNRAAIATVRKFQKVGLKSKIVGQVHDELIFEVPDDEQDIAQNIIRDTMENIVKLTVPLRAVPQFGINYAQCK